MEPQVIDYYADTPSCFKTIDRLNDEFFDLQKKYEELKQKNDLPNIEYTSYSLFHKQKKQTINEIKKKINEFIIINHKILISLYLNHDLNISKKFSQILYENLQILTNKKCENYILNYSNHLTEIIFIFFESLTKSFIKSCSSKFSVPELSEIIINMVISHIDNLCEDIILYRNFDLKI
jgi:hypothetical protein